ncbi:zf-HC2 domain-containing protein [Symbiobacterium thermophilum]|uniref:Anti-sigma-W factor RsiW n=1 Tax=Symbiobacterium thermophilum (strain DSM 24528 / JCM 14929 / IAM 14863 / T) TaxID=292459 RepID=Q67R62_SYMTH|nr:zf-HC2 domain-containing protein [Symbiobacterium thermophilum]BAD39831.1 hypothetical protein STH846 [Symbiobacterium thermophilum IAM 14863]
MNCDGVRPLLSGYIDQELSAGELLRVEQHLRRCHACAAEVDALRQTVALVASLDEVEVPATFHAQLRQRLMSEDPPIARVHTAGRGRNRLHSFQRWAIPAAAAAAFVIGAAGLNRFVPPAAQVEPPPGGAVVAAPGSHVDTAEVPGTTNPPGTDAQEQPHHPVDGPDANPPSGTGGRVEHPEGQLTEQLDPGSAGVVQTTPPPETGDANPAANPATTPAPLGPTRPTGGVTTASTSGDTAGQVELSPQPHFSATAEMTVASPAAEAAQLRDRFDRWRVQENGRVGTVELQIFVPAGEFREAVALVNSELAGYGVALKVQEKDLAGQIAETEDRIATLEEAREALAARLATETSQDRLEEGARELTKIQQQLETERANQQNLREAVENGVIVLTFKPEPIR